MLNMTITPQRPALLEGYDNETHALLQITTFKVCRFTSRGTFLQRTSVQCNSRVAVAHPSKHRSDGWQSKSIGEQAHLTPSSI